MPTEAELRDLLRGDEPERGALDTERIIKRARARRRPKRLAASLTGGIAAVGAIAFTLPVTLGLATSGASTTAESLADQSGGGDESSILRNSGSLESATAPLASAEMLNLCAAPVATVAPDPGGLELTVESVAAPVDSAWIETTVTLTNHGDSVAEGTTGGRVALTLASDGSVLWHSSGPTTMIAVMVDLEPGESMTYNAGFQPVRCSPEHDPADLGLPTDLPPVDPGSYQLSAAIDLVPADGSATRLVTGPATSITLR